MKKFTKIALITALIMLITGGILTAGGILFGASPQAFLNGLERGTKNNSVFNRWFGTGWLERLTDLDDLEEIGEEWENYWEGRGESWIRDWSDETGVRNMNWSEASQKGRIEASKVKSLYVTAEAGEIRIQPSPDEKIWVSGSGLDSSLYAADFDLDTGVLTVSRSDGLVDSSRSLLIQIPQAKVFEELYLNSSAGSLEAEGKLAAGSCDIDVAAGNLEVELMEAEDSTLNYAAGRLKIKYTGKLNDYAADVSVNTGALDLGGESIDGFYEGSFGAESSDKTMDIENNAGNIRIDFENQ
ncbi:MAG TPA: DUF4097 domain-containing protein [Candidatus Blautia merdipullorum]|nr:DUF4097 domain-containing protein [Candidatus Blautia merdipullorum]